MRQSIQIAILWRLTAIFAVGQRVVGSSGWRCVQPDGTRAAVAVVEATHRPVLAGGG